MKKILVTGATGFIGRYVIEELIRYNCDIIATSGSEESARRFPWYPGVEYINFPLESFDDSIDYFSFFKQPDYVIHLAWEGLPNYKSSFHYEINYPRHAAFLKNLLRNGLHDLTVTGTCLEYGLTEGCLREDMDTTPTTAYALAKDSLRKSLEAFNVSNPFRFKWVRLFYMYGKGQPSNSLIPQLEKALISGEKEFNMSGGEQVRDFLPVEVVAANIVKIAFQNKLTGIINCCSGQPVTVKKFVEDYLHAQNRTISLNLGYYPYPDYEPMNFWGDNRKLASIEKDSGNIQTCK